MSVTTRALATGTAHHFTGPATCLLSAMCLVTHAAFFFVRNGSGLILLMIDFVVGLVSTKVEVCSPGFFGAMDVVEYYS